jgi:hypothetical protein
MTIFFSLMNLEVVQIMLKLLCILVAKFSTYLLTFNADRTQRFPNLSINEAADDMTASRKFQYCLYMNREKT